MICDPALDRSLLEGLETPRPKKSPRARPVPADSALRGRTLLDNHFELIQQQLQKLGRLSGLPDHQADELLSWALFKLVENDYRILAGWEGRSSFSTYLTVVLTNLMRDYRIHVWGKWRASAAARRQGPEAVILERLLFRDGLPLDEAARQMRTMHGMTLSDRDIERIAEALPWRTERRQAGEEELRTVPVDGGVEERVQQRESVSAAARLRNVLLPLLHDLSAENRLLLKLHYREGLNLATISRLLGRPQKELYRQHERCLKWLRRHLEKAGLGAGEVGPLIGSLCEFSIDEEGTWE